MHIAISYMYSKCCSLFLQLPPIFDELLQDFIKFRFSDTCLDVFTANYLCPVCRNQPFMCPGRCSEIVTGCVSPLHQSVAQLDTSIRLILCMLSFSHYIHSLALNTNHYFYHPVEVFFSI